MIRRIVIVLVGILARVLLWSGCAFFIYAMHEIRKGRDVAITWTSVAAAALPLAVRAAWALRPRRAQPAPPPTSLYRTNARQREPEPRVRISAALAVDTVVPLAFIVCTMSLPYDPSPEPKFQPMCCCAPCLSE